MFLVNFTYIKVCVIYFQTLSIVSISPCGKYLAGSSKKGEIVIWNYNTRAEILKEKHPRKFDICGLVWNPTGKKEIAFVDVDGHLGTMIDIDDCDDGSSQVSIKISFKKA